MYRHIKAMPLRELIVNDAPSFVVALVVAEMFYKFHSFTLEVLAFLATWYLFGAAAQFVSNIFADRSDE